MVYPIAKESFSLKLAEFGKQRLKVWQAQRNAPTPKASLYTGRGLAVAVGTTWQRTSRHDTTSEVMRRDK